MPSLPPSSPPPLPPPPPPGNRGQVMTLLRGGPMTVNELAEALELTDNGVRAHLGSLQEEGLVEIAGERAGTRKPHQLFGLTGRGRQFFPSAEGPLLRQLVRDLEGTMPERALVAFLKKVGGELADQHEGEFRGASAEKRLKVALKLLAKIGGAAEIEREEGRVAIQGRHCPLANLVPVHPKICAVAEGFLERVLGRGVKERCEKSVPCCRFEVGGE